jgi:hypothetical protein
LAVKDGSSAIGSSRVDVTPSGASSYIDTMMANQGSQGLMASTSSNVSTGFGT